MLACVDFSQEKKFLLHFPTAIHYTHPPIPRNIKKAPSISAQGVLRGERFPVRRHAQKYRMLKAQIRLSGGLCWAPF